MNSLSNFEITQEMLNGSLSVFVFILIITGNYLGELMPCRVRHELSENMLLKHICGYLTLVFFAILTIFKTTQLNILVLSAFVYVYFLVLSKTNWRIWLTVVFMLAISYFLYLFKMVYEDTHEHEKSELQTYVMKHTETVQSILVTLSFILTIFGFFVYMGNKKKEYGKNFSYITFILGNVGCVGKSPKDNFIDDLSHCFD